MTKDLVDGLFAAPPFSEPSLAYGEAWASAHTVLKATTRSTKAAPEQATELTEAVVRATIDTGVVVGLTHPVFLLTLEAV